MLLWLIIGFLLGIGAILLRHNPDIKLAWYDWLMLVVASVFFILAIANYNGTGLVFDGLPLDGSPVYVYDGSPAPVAGFMAAGYARASGKVGCCLVTSGPGATNTVTPLQDALMDGVPLIVASADRPAELRQTGANQTTDQTHLYGRQVRAALGSGRRRA